MKPKIIHLINDLGRGGAENILVQTLPALNDFENYVITLSERNDFGSDVCAQEIINLNSPGFTKLPVSIHKARQLIKKINPSIVHSQLTLSNIIARFATPREIPLFTSIQNSVKYNLEFKKWYIRMLEKRSLKFRPSHVIFVAQSVKNDYYEFLNTRAKRHSILYNFVDTSKFIDKHQVIKSKETFKIISVGSLSYQKNFQFLIKAFLKANIPNAELHIFGEGPERTQLEASIGDRTEQIKLMGINRNIHEILPKYDLYISSSLYEGLSLSVLEAMATGVPQLLTDIPSFREQCDDTAIYYQLNNEADFVSKLKMITNNPDMQNLIAHKSSLRAEQLYDFKDYTQKLKHLYKQTIQKSN